MSSSKYTIGQVVRGAKGAGSRTIVSIRSGVIGWKSGKKTGKCTVKSFESWKKGNNLLANR